MVKHENLYIRMDLDNPKVTGVALTRLSHEMVELMDVIEEQGNEIVGIELDRKESGKFGYNIGFIVRKDKLKGKNNE